ncbi:FHS family glucose/mannose:H+ symporter-like MFS transporter [Paenibacillus phyllosphaerae]|uniref:FHS family glucose/mannose:H+ symporter-like MFS transporter n=1 Tax=Paenibacillus phyllosphaerae TaxID=274593 RepID=A0A7W5B4X1_9BACL|nr:MFS transporter [Paenibacillus phyllosphaerae]MBB3114453.1 FHS family glucose/mannose:H+ symporter-like MFS transporter [Paenibacillus phyllosphaerae]
MRRMVWLGCFAYFMVGLATVVFGALLPELLQDYGKSYTSGGQLVFAQFAGFFLGVALTPRLIYWLGYPRMIWLGMLSLTIIHAVFFSEPMWGLVIAFAALNGCGFGITQTALGTYLLETTDQAAKTMSRLEVAFGIGALFMPIMTGMLIAKVDWIWAFAIVSVAAFVNLLFWTRSALTASRHQPMKTVATVDAAGDVSMDKTPVSPALLLLFVGFIFLYTGLETSLNNFLPSIFSQQFALHSSDASLSVTLLWVAMVVGRFATGYIADRIRYDRFLLYSAIGAGLSLACMTMTGHPIAAFGLVMTTGLFLSGIFAVLIVYANRVFAGNTKRITSTLIASGGVGGAVLPYATGWSMDTMSASGTVWLLVGCAFLMLTCMLRIRMTARRRNAVSVTIDTFAG